jgi:Domain of unknown function (DUF4129)
MRRNGTRALVPGIVVLVLVGIVAVAATGSTSSGTSEARRPSDLILDTFFSLALVALVPAAVLLVWALSQRKAIAHEMASGRYPRSGLATFLVVMAAITAYGWWRLQDARLRPGEELEDVIVPGSEVRPRPTPESDVEQSYEPEFAWIPVLVIALFSAVGVAAYVAAKRRRAAAAGQDDLAVSLAEVLDETLDDLRAEPDPRRAVIAAYARLERSLAVHGLPRRTAETPEEYLGRILRSLEVSEGAVRRLTELFSRAKFSPHEIDLRMKDAAIDSLQTVRDELRAARERDADLRDDPAILVGARQRTT